MIGILACIIVMFVLRMDYFPIPLLLAIVINAYMTFFLRCPQCKLAVLCHRVTFFGTELWMYAPWLSKRCEKCQYEFR